MKPKIGLVVSDFNEEITTIMEKAAEKAAKARNKKRIKPKKKRSKLKLMPTSRYYGSPTTTANTRAANRFRAIYRKLFAARKGKRPSLPDGAAAFNADFP